jgi:hypothetical protein
VNQKFASINVDTIGKTRDLFFTEKFAQACTFVKSIIPGFQIKFKNRSLLMKLLGALLWPFNQKFMTGYVTTLKWSVYFPSEKSIQDNPENAVAILMHEFIHMWDRKQRGVWFSIEYLSPQIWAIVPFAGLAVFGVLLPLWIDCLLFGFGMLCLAPWPSPWRTEYEFRGFTVTLAYTQWTNGVMASSEEAEWIEQQFTGWHYYKMWPFPHTIVNKIDTIMEQIRANKLGTPFSYVKNFLAADEKTYNCN